MFVVCVEVYVKPVHRDAFLKATLENGRGTVQEPGNLRFDVNQQVDDPNRFLLYEVYRDESGMAAHKETPHYALWRDTVAPFMAEPRRGVRHAGIFPEAEASWATLR